MKHTVDAQVVIPAGTAQDFQLIKGVDAQNTGIAAEVNVGSKVNSIFLNVQVINSVDATGLVNNAYMYITGNPGTQIPAANYPAVNAVGASNLRKMIFHQDMAMMSDANDSIPIQLFKGVLKIPRKFGRIGVDDEIFLRVGSPVGGPELTSCVQCIYKEVK